MTKRKVKLSILLSAGLLIFSGCGNDPTHQRISKGERKVCAGMLEPKLYEDDFFSAWGNPDRTSVIAGDDFTKVDVSIWRGIGGGSLFHGHENYVVWKYDQRDLSLAFDKDKQLVSWITSKTIKELAEPLPGNPITCERAKAIP